MKKPTADRLSTHLLEIARKYRGFPETMYRNRSNREAQELFDEYGQDLLTARQTFMAQSKAAPDSSKLATFFDELYCRSLLAIIPEIVERTLRLRRLTLASVPDGDLLTYLKEASRTYGMGFFVASVALSRSAVEAALRHRGAKYLGTAASGALDLKELIERAQLDKRIRDLAHQVRTTGNAVIHEGKAVEADATLATLEAAREVVAHIEGR